MTFSNKEPVLNSVFLGFNTLTTLLQIELRQGTCRTRALTRYCLFTQCGKREQIAICRLNGSQVLQGAEYDSRATRMLLLLVGQHLLHLLTTWILKDFRARSFRPGNYLQRHRRRLKGRCSTARIHSRSCQHVCFREIGHQVAGREIKGRYLDLGHATLR